MSSLFSSMKWSKIKLRGSVVIIYIAVVKHKVGLNTNAYVFWIGAWLIQLAWRERKKILSLLLHLVLDAMIICKDGETQVLLSSSEMVKSMSGVQILVFQSQHSDQAGLYKGWNMM